jgi:hypothetical protein
MVSKNRQHVISLPVLVPFHFRRALSFTVLLIHAPAKEPLPLCRKASYWNGFAMDQLPANFAVVALLKRESDGE